MRRPQSVQSLEDLGRVRLSKSFFMRDFLYSEIANFYGIPNVPDDPELAISAGKRLCEEVLEPLQERFGRISIRSAYRSCAVNQKGVGKHNCASNEANYAAHIWDRHDAEGHMGATACVVVNSFIPYYERSGHWEALAWWIHDSDIEYDRMSFFPKLAAFNIRWHERPDRCIYSQIPPRRGWLTKPEMDNFEGPHDDEYRDWLREVGVGQ